MNQNRKCALTLGRYMSDDHPGCQVVGWFTKQSLIQA